MEKDNIDKVFEKLHSEFDFENPNLGHQERFLEKLKNQNVEFDERTSKKSNFWKPFIGIAASIVLCISLFFIMQPEKEIKDLASVSPEMSETQNFFTTAIAQELLTLNNERTPDTEILISDAMNQMDILEKEYETLKMDLTKSGDDKRVIYAMISNFQSRIEILKNVLETIQNVKQLKQDNNENSITI